MRMLIVIGLTALCALSGIRWAGSLTGAKLNAAQSQNLYDLTQYANTTR